MDSAFEYSVDYSRPSVIQTPLVTKSIQAHQLPVRAPTTNMCSLVHQTLSLPLFLGGGAENTVWGTWQHFRVLCRNVCRANQIRVASDITFSDFRI